MADEKKKKKQQKPVEEVLLRNYPKVIFFWPLFFTSLVLWPIQFVFNQPVSFLGAFWLIVFFVNLFVVAFDFSSAKFFLLILVIVIVVLLIIFFVLPNIELAIFSDISINLGLPAGFYMAAALILGFILLFVFIGAYFDYYKVERNEIYHKKGLFSNAERYPVKSLRIKKEIKDVFEFLILRAGSITLMPGRSDEVIHLPTVLNVGKKADQIDYLLSHVHVEVDELG